eukprot:scaffold95658_cov20-Tisochrysis_lutea.AAC.1
MPLLLLAVGHLRATPAQPVGTPSVLHPLPDPHLPLVQPQCLYFVLLQVAVGSRAVHLLRWLGVCGVEMRRAVIGRGAGGQ